MAARYDTLDQLKDALAGADQSFANRIWLYEFEPDNDHTKKAFKSAAWLEICFVSVYVRCLSFFIFLLAWASAHYHRWKGPEQNTCRYMVNFDLFGFINAPIGMTKTRAANCKFVFTADQKAPKTDSCYGPRFPRCSIGPRSFGRLLVRRAVYSGDGADMYIYFRVLLFIYVMYIHSISRLLSVVFLFLFTLRGPRFESGAARGPAHPSSHRKSFASPCPIDFPAPTPRSSACRLGVPGLRRCHQVHQGGHAVVGEVPGLPGVALFWPKGIPAVDPTLQAESCA